jgi:hypothetical protein
MSHLPRIGEALAGGALSLDKVVELTRFATAETEQALVQWAKGVSKGRIPHRAELLRKADRDEAAQVDQWSSPAFVDSGTLGVWSVRPSPPSAS